MKYLIILALLMLIFSCDKTPNAALFDHNSSFEGYVIFEDSTPDSVQADIKVYNEQETILLAETQTNPTGYYLVDRLAEGTYQVKITAENFSIHNFTDLNLQANSSTILDTINLFAPNSSLEGYINFEDAAPDTISANVFLYYQDETNAVASTQTDTIGYFMFDQLFAGLYELRISAENYEDQNITDIELLGHQTTIVDTIDLELIEPIEFKEIVIDGEIDEGWESAYVNENESSWGGNDFQNLYIARDDDNLYLAVSGTFSNGDNTVNIYIDKDYGYGTGINDFSGIQGGGYGDHLRKIVTAPETFGADLAYSGWALSSEVGIVLLEDPEAVDQNIIDEAEISVNTSVIEFSIPFSVLYDNGEIPYGKKIALVAIIGGGGDEYYTNDSIPQPAEGFTGTFTTVFSRSY